MGIKLGKTWVWAMMVMGLQLTVETSRGKQCEAAAATGLSDLRAYWRPETGSIPVKTENHWQCLGRNWAHFKSALPFPVMSSAFNTAWSVTSSLWKGTVGNEWMIRQASCTCVVRHQVRISNSALAWEMFRWERKLFKIQWGGSWRCLLLPNPVRCRGETNLKD